MKVVKKAAWKAVRLVVQKVECLVALKAFLKAELTGSCWVVRWAESASQLGREWGPTEQYLDLLSAVSE